MKSLFQQYLFRRLASGMVLLAAISLLVFAVSELSPGDFASNLELDPRVSRETLEALRQRYGLDGGVVDRYLGWAGSVAAGDFGYSLAYGRPVGEVLLPRARNTLLLTVPASALAWITALLLGTWAAWREGRWVDRVALGLSALLLSTPALVLGLGCLYLAAWSDFFPLGGMTSLDFDELTPAGKLLDLARHLALPVAALALASLPVLLRHVRSAVLEVLGSPFLRLARGHGIPTRRLLFAYALPAAANPLASLFGLSVASLLSGALLIEHLLAWPGMGPLLVASILRQDVHVVLGATLLSAVVVVVGQVLADLLLYAVDPRIREAP